MKLMIITAVKAFEPDIKRILKDSKIGAYTYKDVTGFRDSAMDAVSSNWFATEMNENESILFFAFTEDPAVSYTRSLVEQFNQRQETSSRVHIAILNIEQSN